MANNMETLSVKLALESGSFSQQMTSINKAVKNLDKDFKSASKGVDNFENTFSGLDAKIRKTTQQIELYNKKLEKQQQQYTKVSNVLERHKQKLIDTESTLGKNSAEWSKQAELVAKNSSKLERLSSDIANTEGNINSLSNELNQATLAFQRLGNQTQTIDERLNNINRSAELAESEFNLLGSSLNRSGQYFQRLGNDINRLASEIERNQNTLSEYESEINRVNIELQQNQQRHSSLATEIQQVESELNQARNAYGETANETQQLNQRLLRLKDEFNSCENEIEQSTNALNGYQAEINNTRASINRLSQEMSRLPYDRIGRDLQNVGGTVKSLGQNMNMYVSAPLIASGVAIGKMSYDFDQGLGKVGSLVNKTGKEMKAYEDRIKSISDATGVSLDQMTEAMYEGISSGADLNNIFKLMESSAKLSVGGFTTQQTAVDGLTSAMNAFGIEFDNVNTVSDKFILTQNNGKTTVDQLAQSIGQVAPTANAAGVSLEELLSATASLTMSGVKTSESMTAIKAALSNVIKPSADAQKVAQELGLEFSTTALQSKGLAGFLEDVKQKTGGNIDTMGKLFGSTEALNAMLLLTGEGADTFKNTLQDMNDTAGLTDKAFKNMKESAGAELKDSINSLKNSLIDMGDALSPMIRAASDGISKLADWFNSLDEAGQRNVLTMASLGISLGPILTGIGTLLQLGGSTSLMMYGFSNAAAGGAGALSGLSGVVGTLAKVGLPVLALAFAGIIESLGSNEDAINSLQDKWGTFGTVVGGIVEVLAGAVEMTFGNLLIMLGGLGEGIMAFLKGDWGSIGNITKETYAKMQVNTSEAMNNMTATTSRALTTIRKKTEEEMTGVNDTFELALKNLPNLTNDKIGKVAETFTKNLSNLDNDSIKILQGTSDSMNVLFDGITANMSKDVAMKTFERNLKAMVQSGKFDAETLQKDIEKAMNLIDQNVSDSSTSVKKSATDMFNAFKTSAKFGVEGAVNEVVGQLNNMEQSTLDQLTSMGGTWKQAFDGIKLDGSMSTSEMKEAVIKNIEAMGIDADTLISQLRKESTGHWKAMEEEATQAGNKVATSFDKVPKEVVTEFKNNGIESEKEVLNLYNLYNQLPTEIQTYIKANGYEALKGAENIQEVLAKIPVEKRIDLLTSMQNEGNMTPDQLQMILDSLPENERVKIETNIQGEEKIDKVKKNVEEIPKEKSTKVSVETGDSSAKVDKVKQDVESLPKEKTTKVNSETSQASKNVTGYKNNLNDFDKNHTGKTKETKFKSDTATASKGVTGLKKNISDFVSKYCKTFTTTFNVKTNYTTTGTPTTQSKGVLPQSIQPQSISAFSTDMSELAQPMVSPMIQAQSIKSATSTSGMNNSIFKTGAALESLKYNINLFEQLENKISEVNNSLNILDKKMDSAVGDEKIKYLQQQITLYEQQKKLQEELQRGLIAQQSELKSFLSSKGFTFDDNIISNYQDKLMSLEKEVERLEEQAKIASEKAKNTKDEKIKDELEKQEELLQSQYNSAKDNLDKIKNVLNEYINVSFSEIPKTQQEWEELTNAIGKSKDEINDVTKETENMAKQLEKAKREQQKAIEEAKWKEVTEDLRYLQNEYKLLEKTLSHTIGKDRIDLLEKQVDLLEKQKNEVKEQEEYLNNMKSKLQGQLKGYGFTFDNTGDITNYSKQIEKLISTSEDFEVIEEILDGYFKIQDDELPKLQQQWMDFDNTIKDIYKNQLNTTQEIEKQITDMYKQQVDERKELIDSELKKRVDAISKEKDLYNKKREEDDYNKQYQEQLDKISKIQEQVNAVSRDTSLSGQAKLTELLKQLEEEKKALDELTQSKIDKEINDMFDSQIDGLEESSDKAKEELDKLYDKEHLQELVKDALGSGLFTDINGEVHNLQDAMLEFTDKYGDGLSICGDYIKTELVGNLEVALETVKDLEDIFSKLDVERFNTNLEKVNVDYSSTRYNPQAAKSSVTNNSKTENVTVNFNQPLVMVQGNVSKDTLPSLEEIIKKAEKEITKNIVSAFR